MDYNKAAIELHKRLKGKIEVTARAETNNKDELSTAYTPGVAAVSYTHLTLPTICSV